MPVLSGTKTRPDGIEKHRAAKSRRRGLDLTLLVLASLADGERHGYAMTEDIRRFADVRLGPGTLYGAITRLERHGWIEPVKSPDRRRPYRLTPSGRAYLEEQLSSLGKVLRLARRRLDHARRMGSTRREVVSA
jgi:DNA-binding PadR family transcriptional regulator